MGLAHAKGGGGGAVGGNGGGKVLAEFLDLGADALEMARHSPQVLALLPHAKEDLARMKGLLSDKFIHVVDQELIDRSGSSVDALGVPDRITLRHSRWYRMMFVDGVDLRHFAFHELLRAAAINDDDYAISKYLLTAYQRERGYRFFPVSLKDHDLATHLAPEREEPLFFWESREIARYSGLYAFRTRVPIMLPPRCSDGYLQDGQLVAAGALDPTKPYCRLMIQRPARYRRTIQPFRSLLVLSSKWITQPPVERYAKLRPGASEPSRSPISEYTQFDLQTEDHNPITLVCPDRNITFGELKKQIGNVFDVMGIKSVDF